MVERLGDAIKFPIIHACESTIHVSEEPPHSMPRHARPAPRGRFSRVTTSIVVPGRMRGPALPMDLSLW